MVDGAPDDRVERGYWSAVDGELTLFLDELEEIEAAGRVPNVIGESLIGFKELAASFLKRSIDVGGRYDPNDIGLDLRDRLRSDFRGDALGDRLSEVEIVQYGRHIRSIVMSSRSSRIVTALEKYELRWAVPESRGTFILGSKMILIAGRVFEAVKGGGDLIFPLSPYRAAVLSPRANGVPLVMRYPTHMIRRVNLEMARSSSQIASPSDTLLRSLISAR